MEIGPLIDEVLAAIESGEQERLRLVLHPYLHWTDADGRTVRGRKRVLAMLTGERSLAPPASYEVRDGQIYRWREAPRAP